MNQLQLFALDQFLSSALAWFLGKFGYFFGTLDDIGRLNYRQHLRFWVCSLDKFQIEDYGCIDASSMSSVPNIPEELDRYLALQVDENKNSLLWWKAHEY
ncbi:hypothetical protein GLOIN_2v1779063 [Rhizophagus irregularis DAOM 181602=DAOM 197198]|uniref:Uncharacterized protein n=1 Tax=Rhizophagus irregularis (strain DAOM 181602 / DAOM 197198 / MUCL 43194) TaxID=747089 RepID=A0A2P4PQP5_RHIID|nr:hypothetical protein GLOIN_2v1779063 [Rhizophagus irregularis DAOM 181602=DAOM 197198]POG67697.1 hypothetical protein GLOIN_2v1779063 [Rhizophagus irregularis DAOM 181602=DAOM 197198]|eukprot:XP_025174563.1 hypothetical protein GLOIN_2v1779063 [Rhizophagus irregularis DAOM 181602=DAOM 197198]